MYGLTFHFTSGEALVELTGMRNQVHRKSSLPGLTGKHSCCPGIVYICSLKFNCCKLFIKIFASKKLSLVSAYCFLSLK